MTESNASPNEGVVTPVPAAFGRSRTCTTAVSPAGTVRVYQKAHLVPVWSGFTVAAPLTTWSLIPSLGYLVTDGQPKSRWLLVSFSQNRVCGAVPSEAWPASSSSEPSQGCWTSTPLAASPVPPAAMDSDGLGSFDSHDQVLRNQAVGSTCTVSASGPALVIRISISRSAASSLLA